MQCLLPLCAVKAETNSFPVVYQNNNMHLFLFILNSHQIVQLCFFDLLTHKYLGFTVSAVNSEIWMTEQDIIQEVKLCRLPTR